MRLTISTERYMHELMDWIESNNYAQYLEHSESEGNACLVTLDGAVRIYDSIVCLLETIMLEQNHIAKKHERLRNVLSSIVFAPVKKDISKIVKKYVSECEHINLEGFVAFRLSEYAHRVDLVLYAAIKNSLMYP